MEKCQSKVYNMHTPNLSAENFELVSIFIQLLTVWVTMDMQAESQ